MTASNPSQHGASPLPEEVESLIQRYLDEDLDAEGFARLQVFMKNDPAVRRRYLAASESVVLLRETAGRLASRGEGEGEPAATATKLQPYLWLPALAAGVVLLMAALAYRSFALPRVGARLVGSTEANWLSPPIEQGGAVRLGTQLQLASGSIELEFNSGASTRIHGPALFEIESKNGGLLHYGKAFSVADNEGSKGFTIRTASGTYVDQGTKFITQAAADGYSQMFVVQGAVDADASGFGRRRVLGGNGIGFEVGATPLMIQIERGSETAAFEFPTIPPPSAVDFTSTHPVDIDVDFRGRPDQKTGVSPRSAAVDVLVNGRAQQNHDDPSESFFFNKDSTGYLVFDLGETLPVMRIHTYSWHRNRAKPELTQRAVQRFMVWGAQESRPASLPDSGNPGGWTRIARVDTDVFFQVNRQAERPPQQAVRLQPATGAIGEFRYLLFEVLPTSDYDDMVPRHTFFSEIDVFTE